MDKLKEAQAQRAKLQADLELRLYEDNGEARTFTDEDRSAIDALCTRIEELDPQITTMVEDEDRFKKAAAAKARLSQTTGRRVPSVDPSLQADRTERVIPATARKYGSLRAFKGPNAELDAYGFGCWFAACRGYSWAIQRVQDMGICSRTNIEGLNTAGGVLVPDQFERTIVDLREQYGAFRKYARIIPMPSDHVKYPRRTGGLTAYVVGESTALTETTKAWDQLTLTAKKIGVITVMSSELSEDAIINMGDDLMSEAAYALAYWEDMAGFMANAEATYGGIVGVGPRLTNLNGVDEGGGIIVGFGDLPSELLLTDFNKTVAILPGYADTPNAAWYCNRTVWANMQRLESAAGGATGQEIIGGYRVPQFLGYPVRMCQVMNVGSAVSQCLAFFGDLALAADMGTRRGVRMATSDSALNAFEQDEVVLKVTERADINVHDVGTATVAGPIVALVGKAS